MVICATFSIFQNEYFYEYGRKVIMHKLDSLKWLIPYSRTISNAFFVQSACGELDIAITMAVWCMYVPASVIPSGPHLNYASYDFHETWHKRSP